MGRECEGVSAPSSFMKAANFIRLQGGRSSCSRVHAFRGRETRNRQKGLALPTVSRQHISLKLTTMLTLELASGPSVAASFSPRSSIECEPENYLKRA